MIGHISGILVHKQPPQLMVDVAGVAYELEAPMTAFYNLPAIGEKVGIRVLGHPEDEGLPGTRMEVVRHGADGIGLIGLD